MENDYLYHVSLLVRLGSIATNGLFPGRSENWPGYSSHARGRVFLTTEPAVNGWIHKVTYSAAATDTDRPVEEGFIPVVLRVPLQQVEEFLHEDTLGSQDVPEGKSYYVESTIHPDELEVYTPSGWVPVDVHVVQDMLDYALEHAPRDRDDEDEEEYLLLDEYVFAPNPGTHRRVQVDWSKTANELLDEYVLAPDQSQRRHSWGETTNVFMVHTCGRNSILPECEGAEGFTVFPAGNIPKSKRKKKKGMFMVHQGNVYHHRRATTTFKAPTKEMKDFFKKRTQDHIHSVVKYMKLLKGFGKGLSTAELSKRAKVHDKDKYSDQDLILPYIWVTEYHRVNNDKEGSVSDELQEQYDLANKATGKHVEKNLHHPEAHSSIEDMSDLDLAEMVCDWAAMAEELGQGSPRGWADDNVGSKWKFSEEQEKFIYDVIDWLEGKK